MNAEIRIQPATHAMADEVIELWQQLMAEHRAIPPGFELADDADHHAREMFFPKNDTENQLLLVSHNGERAVGFIFGMLIHNLPIYDPPILGYITDCVVDPDYRNRGIGLRLVQHLLDWFAEQGVTEIEVSVAAHNPAAIRFWSRTGAQQKFVRLSYRKG